MQEHMHACSCCEMHARLPMPHSLHSWPCERQRFPARQVVDVGGGTGFCTQGIVQSIPPQNVTLIDQSPHQLAKARRKADLQGVTILEVRAFTVRPACCKSHLGRLQSSLVRAWRRLQARS